MQMQSGSQTCASGKLHQVRLVDRVDLLPLDPYAQTGVTNHYRRGPP